MILNDPSNIKPIHSLNCLQINLRHSKLASANLAQLLLDLNIDVALIQEPYAIQTSSGISMSNVPDGYNSYHNLSADHAFGAAILAKKSLGATKSEFFLENYSVGVNIYSFTLASFYCRPSSPEIKPFLDPIAKARPEIRKRLIVSMDANARNPLWNSLVLDKKGRDLEDLLHSLSLNINNRPRKELVFTPNCSSMVDITLGGDEVAIENWRFLDLDSLSDHPFIFFNISHIDNPLKVAPRKSSRVPKIKNLNTQKYVDLLATKILKLDHLSCNSNKDDLESFISSLTNVITSCATKCKYRIPCTKINKLDWWNRELWGLRHKLRTSFKTKNKKPCASNELNYKKAKADYQREIRRQKRESWIQFCSKNMNKDIFGSLKRIADPASNRPSIPDRLLVNNIPTANKSEIVAILTQNFFPKSKTLNSEQQVLCDSVESNLVGDFSGNVITMHELSEAVKEMNANSSPGEDGLTAELLQFSFELIKHLLLKIFNRCLALSYFPKIWKRAMICILKKSGKESYEDAKSFRPISVLCILGKIYELIIHKRLRWYSQANQWISSAQHGFMEGKSTETAAHDLVYNIEASFNKKSFTAVAFLDITSAFDSAWPTSILDSLLKKDCPVYLVKIIKSFLSDRVGLLNDNGKVYSCDIEIGCPQGSVLSPFLWIVLIDNILRLNFPFNHKIIAYADDITIATSDKVPSVAVDRLQVVVDAIICKLKEILLNINPLKSVLMVFTKTRKPLPSLSITINDYKILPSNSNVFLGLEFDSKLNWRKHIENKCLTTKKLMHSVGRYLRLTWGLDTNTLKTFYSSTIIPTLLYGCSTWVVALKSKRIRSMLLSTQRIFLRYITRSFKSVSTQALQVLSDTLPIDLKIYEISCNRRFMFSNLNFSLSAKKSIDWIYSQVHIDAPIDQETRFFSPTHPPWSICTNLSFSKLSQNTLPPFPVDPNTLCIFTDGAKSGHNVGCSAVCSSSENNLEVVQKKLSPNTSAYQAECTALHLALTYAKDHDSTFTNVNIYSDCLSALSASTNSVKVNSQAKLNRELLLDSNQNISLFWIPSHSGIDGNELADIAAKEAAHLNNEPTTITGQEKKSFVSSVKKLLRQHWDVQWQSAESSKQVKEFFPSLEDANILRSGFLHHEVTQVITGHSLLNYHLNKIGLKNSPACACGAASETVVHFIFECPLLQDQRKPLISACSSLNIKFPPSLHLLSKSTLLWKSFLNLIFLSKRLNISKK